MAFPQGIAFRATSGYVTDGANDYGEVSLSKNYPTTSTQGNTVGWENKAPGGTRDRSTSVDHRLAGITYVVGAGKFNYRIDLPALGAYKVRVAAGDATSGQYVEVELFDAATSLGTLVPSQFNPLGTFVDATNTNYSAAAWPAGNTLVSETFASTICRFAIGDAVSSSNLYAVAYVYIESASGGGITLTGSTATNSVGNASAQIIVSLTGQEMVSSAGTLGASVSSNLTGVGTAGVVGSLSSSLSANLLGQAFNNFAGILSPGVALGLIGQGSAYTAGSVSLPGGVNLSGNLFSSLSGSLSGVVNATLLGNSFTSFVGRVSAVVSGPVAPGKMSLNTLSAGLLLSDFSVADGSSSTIPSM